MTVLPAPDALAGCLLGTAIGDALGLPYENLSPRRAARLLGPPDRYRFFLGRGMISDDTEHSCMVAEALLSRADEADDNGFVRDLARRFRWWLATCPAGIGFATLRAIVKLWLGWSPLSSGVFSAGNGPAMRSAILGAAVTDRNRLRSLVRLSTRLTHTDPKAEYGALAVALAARLVRERPEANTADYQAEVESHLPAEASGAGGFLERLRSVFASVQAGQTTPAYAAEQGWQRGVSGYVYHSVPVALHAWLSHPREYAQAVGAAIRCGGDTDTIAAITGGIVGTAVGRSGLPADWIAHLRDWPRSVAWIERLATALGEGQPPPLAGILPTMVRNAGFFAIVLGHIARRMLPPY